MQNTISILLLLWFTITLVDSTERLHHVLILIVASVAVASVYVIREWLPNRGYAGYRPGGIATDANYFALCAAAATVLAITLLKGKRPKCEKVFLLGCSVVNIPHLALRPRAAGSWG